MRPKLVVSKLFLIPLVTLCVSTPVPRADEVVWFASGSFLRVLSHTVEGEMIRVRLDSNASMAFPMKMVDKIDKVEGALPATTPIANQSFPSQPQAPRPFDPGATNAAPPNPMPQGMAQRPQPPLVPKGGAEAKGSSTNESLIDRFNHGFTKSGTAIPGAAIDPRARLPQMQPQGTLQLPPRKEAMKEGSAENGQDPKR